MKYRWIRSIEKRDNNNIELKGNHIQKDFPPTDGVNIDTENFVSTLRTSFIGRRIYLYQTVESTQTIALSLAEQETDNLHGTVIVSEHQTKGRGRMGRSWISPPGGIWLSIILKPKIKNSQITVLPLLSALSVCDVIKKMTKLNARVKWPNDVVIDGRKVSGILLDLSTTADKIDFVVIGIGVNVNIDIKKINSDIVKSAGFYDITSLQNELHGKEIEKFDFIRLLLENIERYVFQLENEGAREIIKKSKKISDTLGREVIVKRSNEILQGVAVDMDENDGFLIIETPYGCIHKVVSGDVIFKNITKK
ncbi:MAG TPA: biotin--[acetyl-CoA-carboxylase] ligase [Nitrososphaeraceae archaeon]|nr:biotin--[acetyl-CoA-carboxylase] ligase [Nitrososphaeraceae archaeon]